MLASDGRIYNIGSCILPHALGGDEGERGVCHMKTFSFLECIKTSETDLAHARTVNSLPHLDVACLIERGGEGGGGRGLGAYGWGGSHEVGGEGLEVPSLGDVTCMALVRDEGDPIKDVVLTGSLDGWVHCWSHGHL